MLLHGGFSTVRLRDFFDRPLNYIFSNRDTRVTISNRATRYVFSILMVKDAIYLSILCTNDLVKLLTSQSQPVLPDVGRVSSGHTRIVVQIIHLVHPDLSSLSKHDEGLNTRLEYKTHSMITVNLRLQKFPT